MNSNMDRRKFLKITGKAGSSLGAGLVLGRPVWTQETKSANPPPKPKTNIDEVLKVPRTPYSLPGPFPGRVVEISDAKAMTEKGISADIVKTMIEKGITSLTGKDMAESFSLFFKTTDIVGIKVNPVGAGLISTRLEVRSRTTNNVVRFLIRGTLPKTKEKCYYYYILPKQLRSRL